MNKYLTVENSQRIEEHHSQVHRFYNILKNFQYQLRNAAQSVSHIALAFIVKCHFKNVLLEHSASGYYIGTRLKLEGRRYYACITYVAHTYLVRQSVSTIS